VAASAAASTCTGGRVTAIEGDDRVDGVRFPDGSKLAAAVVLGLGTVPETGWLADSGLIQRDGAVRDGHLAATGVDGTTWRPADIPGTARTCGSNTGRTPSRRRRWSRSA